MASFYINDIQKYPNLPYEFFLDGTEGFNKGELKFVNETDGTPIDDYAEIKIVINSNNYEFIRESDMANRMSQGIYTHPVSMIEPVLMLKDVQIPDRAMSTHEGVQVTYRYQLETIIETSELPYTVDTDTLTLLEKKAEYQQYSSDFLTFLVVLFRGVDAIPTLSLSGEIGHKMLNEKNNDVTTYIGTLLEADEVEARLNESNIADYASSAYSKIKNGAYEEDLDVGATYFPSKTSYVTVRSSDNKYSSDNAQVQFDRKIKRITQAILNLTVSVDTQNDIGTFGSTGDLPSTSITGNRYTCDEDGYYSAEADETFNIGDTAMWVYSKWFKNINASTDVIIDLDFIDYVISKEEWDKKEISTNNTTLLAGLYQNNTVYYTEGTNLIQNIGTQYRISITSEPTTFAKMLESFASLNNLDISTIVNDIVTAEWRFQYIPSGDIDTDIERHTSKRVSKKIVKTNQQQESRIEMGRFGKSNFQYVNRMGNDRFQITIRHYDESEILELFDYYNEYKLVKIKLLVNVGYIDATYSFVKNQSSINVVESFTNPTSPYTIQDKLEVNTCYVRKHYVVFGNEYTDNDLNSSVKIMLWNRFNYYSSYDNPIYNAVYTSTDSDEDINMTVQKAIEGRGFTFNTNFTNKVIAGYKSEIVGIGNFTYKMTPINYTNEYGEVEDCIIYYCNEVISTPANYPIADSYTSIFGDYTRTVKLQPNEILGETQRIECISDRENLFIYKPYLLNNSLIKEIGEECTLRSYFYDKPIFTTDTQSLPSGWIANELPTITNYKITLSGTNVGYSYAIADSLTGELYFAYNYYDEDLLVINMSLRDENPNIEGNLVEWVEVTSGTVTGGSCTTLTDIGNIKEELSVCSFTAGVPYFSATDVTTPEPSCSDGATYTVCTYNGVTWVCTDYTANETTVKYECQLK